MVPVRYVRRGVPLIWRATAERTPLRRRGGIAMKRFALGLLVGFCLLPVRPAPSVAAEIAVTSSDAEPSTPVRRHIRRVERRPYVGCPDRYSCYPLYGAYGPYGGQAYWAAYSGWYRY